MNLRKRKRPAAEVHTSAMNDIMFFLMLFFLIAATVTNPNIVPITLPRTDTGQSLSKKTINLAVTKDLQYFLEKQPIAFEQLQSGIQAYQKGIQELTVVLYVEKTVSTQDFLDVYSIGSKINVKMVVATQRK